MTVVENESSFYFLTVDFFKITVSVVHDDGRNYGQNMYYKLITEHIKMIIFTFVPCILTLSKFFNHQQMHKGLPCWSYFNVNFNIVFKTITCALIGE